MAIIQNGPAPYAPLAHVLRSIDLYREKAPATMTKELLMRVGFPAAYANRTLRALKLLDLVDDDGTPTDAFKELRRATDGEYPARLEQVIRAAYSDVFEVVDPTTDGEAAISSAFAFNEPAAQRDKMVVLFRGLCEAAGIPLAGASPRKRTMRAGGGYTPRPSPGKGHAVAAARKAAEPPPAPQANHEPPKPGPVDSLRTRYVEILLAKAEAQDQLDEKLLDRIEALLREEEQKD
jgi:hypothetical protein